ncbi:uracil-DNA glycosylase [Nitrococcus mobilis]|uniref:Type-4 uracil-DNA glycosylase n=1 Tax=Nitrococcus mobilis Nb-231 TaxID=314278 RepID=A4BLM0_9GAMM|nr:uracil-DNA glycosylase [Nitrococcus mobilis]EAR23208.1 Phage SPO1 DNA polymerase-related protein [Nitrococcus mobilis Nb-231]
MKTRDGLFRLQYLQRLGIDVWVRRQGGAAEQAPVENTTGRASIERLVQPGVVVEDTADTNPARLITAEAEIARLDWEALRERVQHCERCLLHQTRMQGVFGIGNPQAQLMLIGEAPGAEEDRRGEPFVGRAGKLLDEMLRAIGLSRERVYITNVLKSRPPNNRDPTPDEVAACEPYLRRQLELIAPSLILALGRIAAQYLLKSTQSLGRLRGAWHHYGPRATPLRVTYHPAYLLRSPADKHKAWQDLKQVRQCLRHASPSTGVVP